MTEPNIPPGFDFTDPDMYVTRVPTEELAELRRTAREDGAFHYTFFKAVAVRGEGPPEQDRGGEAGRNRGGAGRNPPGSPEEYARGPIPR